MDMMTKGTLIRVCLSLIAVLFAAGFVIFLIPVFTGILNIGNAAGMFVCAAMFFLIKFRNKVYPLILEHKALKIVSVIVIIIAALLMLLAIVISAFMISAANAAPKGNTVIILGCKVRGETPSLMLNKRIMAACGYLKENPEAVCIASGGQGSDELISEAECIKRVLVANGISEDRIILEDKSTSTDENIRFSMEKMKEHGLKGGAVIATSAYHQLRVKMTADSYGLESSPLPSDTALWLLPTYWVREWFGVTYQYFKYLKT